MKPEEKRKAAELKDCEMCNQCITVNEDMQLYCAHKNSLVNNSDADTCEKYNIDY